jgi:hypothetical protein
MGDENANRNLVSPLLQFDLIWTVLHLQIEYSIIMARHPFVGLRFSRWRCSLHGGELTLLLLPS